MEKSPKVPELYELAAIEPASSSVAADTLSYANLGPTVAEQRHFENARYDKFYETAPDSVQEESKARALARLYMVMTAHKINGALTDTTKELWTDRFTNATIELYGEPDVELAKAVGTQRTHDLLTSADTAGVDSQLVNHYRKMMAEAGFDREVDRYEQIDYSEVAEKVGDYIQDRYADVFAALGFDSKTENITAEEFAAGVERAFQALAANHDEAWGNWSVERGEETDRLVTYAKSQKLVVGSKRSSLTPSKAKGVFAHEILVHGLRGLNGKKLSSGMQVGLPGYGDADEGLGVFMDYAVTGIMPEKIADKYVDIALALGSIDGRKRSRREMIDVVSTRMLIQNELKNTEEKEENSIVIKNALSHVKRIYRGTLGNEFVGVFTKDIAYFKGFTEMANYMTEEINSGKSVGEVIDYLMLGKFNPLNERHVAEVERLRHER